MSRLALVIALLCAAVAAGAFWFLTGVRDGEPAAGPAAVAVPDPVTPPPEVEPVPEDAGAVPAAAPVAPVIPEEPELGTLHIDADVEGALVFIDREYIGTTPVTARDIRPGSHRLNVSAEGFDGVSETIDVEPGPRELTFMLRPVRLDAAVDVVHRHRFGSCEGRLVATPDGLRFEAREGDDGFSVALDRLQTFEVDYLGATLTVQPAGGRSYDFRHPADDADQLFVFHRDVERAIERLASP